MTNLNGKIIDKNGSILTLGCGVDVPTPNSSDMHNFAFHGIVIDINYVEQTVCVEDMDENCFDILGRCLLITN
jgi:hypothetical protein